MGPDDNGRRAARRLAGAAGTVAMGLLFFGVLTPLGVAMRALGRDPLRLRADPASASYWLRRRASAGRPAPMTRQF